MNPVPLLIIMGAILALLAVQRWLTRATPPQAGIPVSDEPSSTTANSIPVHSMAESTASPPRPRGRLLTQGLSVTGLDERGMNSLKALIRKADIEALTTFLAFNRPGFVEIDTFLGQPQNQSSTETGATATLPAQLLKKLGGEEQKRLQGFNPRSSRLITRELMARFGGHEFNLHFGHYAARPSSVTLHIPPFDPERKIFEDLVQSGMARKGRHIPLAERLTVLKMSQLRQMAKDLKLDKKFTRKKEATHTLAEVPGAAVLLSMQYVIDDLFMLLPMEEDTALIKQEWTSLEAYAKLLCGIEL